MVNYDDLKKSTYLFLLSDSDDAKKLILATLMISLCHDKCISDNKLLVTPNFIKTCCLLVPFNMNYDHVSVISDEEKFSLIRNKLAHGDFVYNESKREIYIKHVINGDEVMTSMNLDQVVEFACSLLYHYDFFDSKIARESIVVNNGYKMIIRDLPVDGRKRTGTYKANLDLLINRVRSYLPRVCYLNPERKKYTYSNKWTNLDVLVEKTEEDNYVIMNSQENILTRVLYYMLNDLNRDLGEFNEIIDLLCKFYVIFIYPLENFLKKDDKNVYSLQNGQMFDFSSLNIDSIDKASKCSTVGKTKSYSDDLMKCYNKLGNLYAKRDKLKGCKAFNPSVNAKLIDIEKEIQENIDLFCNSSVQLIYQYSKNRSIIEHIRCSMMHGNYSYDNASGELTFIDIWHNEELYNNTISLDDFRELFNAFNTKLIKEQFIYSYSKK